MGGRAEVMKEYQRAHNDDPDSTVEAWAPASFEASPQLTKRRVVHFRSQIKAPAWIKKLLGARACARVTLPAMQGGPGMHASHACDCGSQRQPPASAGLHTLLSLE